MTLTAEQSSNKARYEAATTAEIIDIIRTAMGEGCIRPCHVYDAVDELICRIQALEKRTKRNCDVGTADEQAKRFVNFCLKHIGCAEETGGRHCVGCPLEKASRNITQKCELYWAQMPYVEKKGGAK